VKRSCSPVVLMALTLPQIAVAQVNTEPLSTKAVDLPQARSKDAALNVAPSPERWRVMREVVENAVSRRLIDPQSAQFEWPFGFSVGWWKPFLQKRVHGFVTCGYVNSKNRMGGYVGRTAFAAVINDGAVTYLDIGTGRDFDPVSASCAKTAQSGFFQPAPTEMLASEPQVPKEAGSLADELTKLVKLRESGVLTAAEFEAAKAKLLR